MRNLNLLEFTVFAEWRQIIVEYLLLVQKRDNFAFIRHD